MPSSQTTTGHRKPSKDGRVYITLRLDPDLVKRLDVECEERTVSRTYLVEKVMRAWLEEHAETA